MARAWAPGRVNIIGEHTDYSEGLVLPTAVPQRVSVELLSRADQRVHAESDGFAPIAYRLGDERRATDWGDYVRGVTWSLRAAGHAIRGFDARVSSSLPSGAGLASSAALEVAILRALREAFALALDDLPLALLAHRAEAEFVGARVGTMDQIAASLAREGEALLIDTRTVTVERVPIPAEAALVVIDTGTRHAHATGGYNERRAECEKAARLLGLLALRDATNEDAERLAKSQPVLARRVRHVITENARVVASVSALRAGDLGRLGDLLDASHLSLRDDFAVSVPEVDLLAEILRAESGVHGARMVGGGFGGSVLAIADAGAAAGASRRAAKRFVERTGGVARILIPTSA